MMERGAFPGRYPGILARRPKLFAMESHSFDTSSGGNSICSVETEPGCVSTSTFMNERRYWLANVSANQVTAINSLTSVLLLDESRKLCKHALPSSILHI